LLQGPRVEARIETLIVAEDAFAQADAVLATALRDALGRMASALPEPRALRAAPDGFDGWREAFRIIQAREAWATYGPFIRRHQPRPAPGTRERWGSAEPVREDAARAARRWHGAARLHIHGLVPPGTVLALPTAPSIAPPLDAPADALESFRTRVMRLTCMAGLGGLPQVSIPAGTAEGCPIGLSFIAWSGGDEALLDLAVAVARHVGVAA